MSSAPGQSRTSARLRHLLVASTMTLLLAGSSQAQLPAPLVSYPDPNVQGLISLPGDLVRVSYGAGNLDRAARLQFLLEPMLRTLNRWTDTQVVLSVYALTAEEWRRAQIGVPYGVPVRIGRSGLAVPAEGNDEVVRLWSQLRVPLPASQQVGTGGLNTPQFASSMVMADCLSFILIGEIYADQLRISSGERWVGGVVAQSITTDYIRRERPEILLELDQLYSGLSGLRGPRALASSDYRPDIGLSDYLWFQAQFFYGGQNLLSDEGRGAAKRLRKLTRKGDGQLLGAALLDEYKTLREWYHATFAAVSVIPR